MPFVAAGVIWGGYTLAWWGWLALTDRVRPGLKDTIWWPSIMDLIKPGNIGKGIPPKLSPAGSPGKSDAQMAAENQAAVAAGKPPPDITIKGINR